MHHYTYHKQPLISQWNLSNLRMPSTSLCVSWLLSILHKRKYLLTNYKLLVYFLGSAELLTKNYTTTCTILVTFFLLKKICSASHFQYAHGWERSYFLIYDPDYRWLVQDSCLTESGESQFPTHSQPVRMVQG